MKEENTYHEHNGNTLPEGLRMNPFSVPKGYFDDLEDSIRSQISAHKLKGHIGHSSAGFTVPDGYFEEFATHVQSHIFVDRLREQVPQDGFAVPEGYFDQSRIQVEAAIAASELKDRVTEDGYTVPEGYFDQLAQQSLAMARIDRSVSATSESFRVPNGYFDTLSARILSKVSAEQKPASADTEDTPVVKMPARKTWTQYAAAAVIAMMVSIGSYWALDSSHQARVGAAAPLALEELSNDEIFHYLTQVTDDVDLIELASFLPEDTFADDDTYEVDTQLKDQEIEEYLNYML